MAKMGQQTWPMEKFIIEKPIVQNDGKRALSNLIFLMYEKINGIYIFDTTLSRMNMSL